MNDLQSNLYTDFLMWRHTFTMYRELYLAGHMDETAFKARLSALGLTEPEARSELSYLASSRKPVGRPFNPTPVIGGVVERPSNT